MLKLASKLASKIPSKLPPKLPSKLALYSLFSFFLLFVACLEIDDAVSKALPSPANEFIQPSITAPPRTDTGTNTNTGNTPSDIATPSPPTIFDRLAYFVSPSLPSNIIITYKPFAREHNDKFSLGDFDSPYLIQIENYDFAPTGTLIINDEFYALVKTNYLGSAYFGIADLSFADYLRFATANASKQIFLQITIRSADDTDSITTSMSLKHVTVTAPTHIHTWQDLQAMKHDLTADYRLMSDITFPGKGTGGLPMEGFEPVGDGANRFTGSFAGEGHRIANLSIDRGGAGVGHVGIWGVVGRGTDLGVIENFVVDHAGIRGGNGVGAVVGYLAAGTVNNVGVVSSQSNDVTGNADVGGLLGVNETGTVMNSYATGNVAGNGNNIGGLVGNNSRLITNSYATGAVNGAASTGGLVGVNGGGTVNGYATGVVEGNESAGGLVGFNNNGTVNGHATGAVTGKAKNTGGLVGLNNNRVTGYATGAVTGTGNTGGLVGINNGGTVNGHATGAVMGNGTYIGGLVGFNLERGRVNGYASGNVEGDDEHVGGLVGRNSSGTVNGYALGNVVGRARNVGGLLGSNGGSGTVTGYATGAVTGAGDRVGGLVGWNGDAIVTGYATGNVRGRDWTGGLVGYNQTATVTGYATGNVRGGNNTGGLVGRNYNGNALVIGYATGNVNASRNGGGLVGRNNRTVIGYATGNVTGGQYLGRLIGSNNLGTTDGYWLVGNSGQRGAAASNGGTFRGVGISSISNVIFSTGVGATPDTYTDDKGTTASGDDVAVFDNGTFQMHFTPTGGSGEWPTLDAANSFSSPDWPIPPSP